MKQGSERNVAQMPLWMLPDVTGPAVVVTVHDGAAGADGQFVVAVAVLPEQPAAVRISVVVLATQFVPDTLHDKVEAHVPPDTDLPLQNVVR
jgi:hypothetical protein